MRAAYVYIVTPKKECAIDTNVAFTSKRLLYDYYGKEYLGITYNTLHGITIEGQWENSHCLIQRLRLCEGRRHIAALNKEREGDLADVPWPLVLEHVTPLQRPVPEKPAPPAPPKAPEPVDYLAKARAMMGARRKK